MRFSRFSAAGIMAALLLLPFAMSGAAIASDNIANETEVAGPNPREAGAWRERVQLVFDPSSGTLKRRRYTLWDPRPSLNRTFTWEPADEAAAAPGRITGRGRIIWREQGRPSYDASAVVAEYAGDVRDGRVAGRGTLKIRPGYYYSGTFRDGLMHGEGKLQLPGGDHFKGRFVNGKAHGSGRFIDVTGEVYDGPFVRGRRHGTGTTTLPSGLTYQSQWHQGRELPASRRIRLAQRGNSGGGSGGRDLRIGITLDQRVPRLSQNQRTKLDESDLRYRTSNRGREIRIFPDRPRLMELWKGNGPIHLKPLEERNFNGREYGVFSFSSAQLHPLRLNVQFQNRSSRRVRVVGAYLEVARSVEERKPAIQISAGSYSSCGGLPGYFRPSFLIENFGWEPARNAELTYRIEGSGGGIARKRVGDVSRRTRVDFVDDLRRLGLKTRRLRRAHEEGFTCRKGATRRSCMARLERSGLFGQLAGAVEPNDESVVAFSVQGELSFEWRDGSGRMQRETRPFKTSMPLAYLQIGAECGEGGERQAITTKTLQMRLGENDYRLPINYRTTVPAGRTARFVLPVTAPRSSEHDFRFVVRLSDGRSVRSRPINLLYFKPSWLPEDVADPEPESGYARRNYRNFDLIGSDLRNMRNVESWNCSTACEENNACVAYTYDAWNKWCYLKRSVRSARFDPKYLSRVIRGNALPVKETGGAEVLRFRGKVFPDQRSVPFETRVANDFDECARYCAGKRICVAFSHVRARSLCRFYERVEAYVSADGVDSGVKRVRP